MCVVSCAPLTSACRVWLFRGARSSAVEHCLDMAGVTGSIPVVPTIFPLLLDFFKPKEWDARAFARTIAG